MCGSMADIQSAAAEIRRGKKRKKERTNHTMKIYMVSLFHRATINNSWFSFIFVIRYNWRACTLCVAYFAKIQRQVCYYETGNLKKLFALLSCVTAFTCLTLIFFLSLTKKIILWVDTCNTSQCPMSSLHRRRRRDEIVDFRCICVGGVNWTLLINNCCHPDGSEIFKKTLS